MKKILLIIFLSTTYVGNSQLKDRNYYLDMPKALGYYYGVEVSLDNIIHKYPDLSKKAMVAKMNFEIAHKKSIENLEKLMESQMKLEKNEFKKKIANEVKLKFDLTSFSHADASYFLNNFENERIKGNHDLYKEFVAILLRHNPLYVADPVLEFRLNYKNRFETDNHPKSKGLNLSLEYPKSWSSQEGKRPNIITMLRSFDGACGITILVKDIIQEIVKDKNKLSKSDLDNIKTNEFSNEIAKEMMTEKYARQYVSELGLENISDFSFKKTKLEGQPTMIVRISGDINRALVNSRMHLIHYIVIYQNYIIIIGSSISDDVNGLTHAIEKYGLLSEMIMNSLIIKNKW